MPIRPAASRTLRAALGLSLALALPALAACQDREVAATAPSPTRAQEATAAPSPSSPSSSAASSPSPGSSQDPSASGPASWTFPINAPGWRYTTRDQNGVNQFTNDAGCLYTVGQNLVDGPTAGDRADTEAISARIESSFEQQSGATNIVFTSEDDATTIKTPGGEPVETIRKDWTYTVNGQDYQGTQWVRVFTASQTPTDMRVMYACPVGAYSQVEMDSLLKETTLTGAWPLDMDDPAATPPGAGDGQA
ncbi:hypothetical protein [Actinomyces bowdenii]|uniref:Serine/arginine repetitive matrix protein 1 n=1 Tax=Actinomyces bowdenii TaxID=131109 RepID=A0A3P1V6C9_9ACTO|nr:hypothetical protein [Actinomyces bowdenii]RRD29701.1 hypothetical protein EII10_05150 [Actinomyces bowdenii]